MSAREEAQAKLVEHLVEHHGYWTGPYGVRASLHELPGGGKVRVVLFGVSAYLDASAYVWSPTRITVNGAGPLAHAVEGEYGSVDELIAHLSELYR